MDPPAWEALHTGDSIFVEYEGDRPELYDLIADPFQLENLAGDPDRASVVEDFRRRLEAF